MASKAYSGFYSVGAFFKCLATGVAYLHDEVIPHIINLDIKLENIIVRHCADRRRLTVFITDFGVSRSFQPSSPSTDVNTLYTTPTYQAPEIAKKREYGRKADIFSMECVFSEMASILAGRTLRAYSNRRDYIPGIAQSSVAFENNLPVRIVCLEELETLSPFKRPPTGRSPEWWMRLLNLIKNMMSENPSKRYTSE
ncbi:kinase-like protein [Lentithecium fluviatile CBS 122367]|uniref:Kinase-like protein n=1 Tax=Lentithecium fluviatile CBS 122367 TaxID=1168545 RepID=A0A6G1IR27_9PLEO|nr:kinase-like protein [Lentithecium fluviatile CBS 122367]